MGFVYTIYFLVPNKWYFCPIFKRLSGNRLAWCTQLEVAPGAGLEPATTPLTAVGSTIELPRNVKFMRQ